MDADLVWIPHWPYWEWFIYDSRSGNRAFVFHWGIKKMSEYGVDDGLVGKIEACLGLMKKERIS